LPRTSVLYNAQYEVGTRTLVGGLLYFFPQRRRDCVWFLAIQTLVWWTKYNSNHKPVCRHHIYNFNDLLLQTFTCVNSPVLEHSLTSFKRNASIYVCQFVKIMLGRCSQHYSLIVAYLLANKMISSEVFFKQTFSLAVT